MVILPHPLAAFFDPLTGTMTPCDRYRQVRLGDMRGYYLADRQGALATVEPAPLLYEVYELDVPAKDGEMIPCSTVIKPGRIGDEYFMTKGHYHNNGASAEIYYCLRGEGFLLMRNESEIVVEPMKPGSLHYSPAGWAHRSVNTGNADLVIFAIYPANAGHDYGTIKEMGFGRRVVRGTDGQPMIVDEPDV